MRQHIDDTSKGCANVIKGQTNYAQMTQENLSHRSGEVCVQTSDTAVVEKIAVKNSMIITSSWRKIDILGQIAHRAAHFLTALGLLVTHRVAGAEHNSLDLCQEALHATDRLLGLVHADRQLYVGSRPGPKEAAQVQHAWKGSG